MVVSMASDLRILVETSKPGTEQVARKKHLIYQKVLQESAHLDGGNFTAVHTSDLQRLFDEYDRYFFESRIGTMLSSARLRFRLSKRMTSAGGKTTRYRHPARRGTSGFEISVSTTLLFQCFDGHDHRPITVVGITCKDRLEALQCVMEHEIVHLIEFALWSKSSCSAARFQSIASRLFSHQSHTHQLITPRERASEQFGVKPGDYVQFRQGDVDQFGRVTRITKRATVLVGDAEGALFSDGRRYLTYYVPVERLKVTEKPSAA